MHACNRMATDCWLAGTRCCWQALAMSKRSTACPRLAGLHVAASMAMMQGWGMPWLGNRNAFFLGCQHVRPFLHEKARRGEGLRMSVCRCSVGPTRLIPMPTTPPSMTRSFCSILRASDLHGAASVMPNSMVCPCRTISLANKGQTRWTKGNRDRQRATEIGKGQERCTTGNSAPN